MDITVTFENGRWVTDPDPAIVAVGTLVRWVLRAPELNMPERLLWQVHFRERRPFGQESRTLEVTTQLIDPRAFRETSGDVLGSLSLSEDVAFAHRGVTQPQLAERPGDYKYDLSVQDASTGEQIGDDDPMLFVVRGFALIGPPFELFAF